MDTIYSIRLDRQTNQRLLLLANHTFRSRASVVRWLINQAVLDLGLITPEGGLATNNLDISIIGPAEGSNEEVQA